MVFRVGDKVNIKDIVIDTGCPMDSRYMGKEGIVIGINEDRPSPIIVQVKRVGTDSFWEEELEK